MLVIGLPIGISMGIMGFVGLLALRGFGGALTSLFTIPYSSAASWSLSVIPMFVLMGYLTFYSGFAEDAYNTAYKWVGRLPGGIAIATLIGSGFFAAASGSSIAATATLGKMSLPQMQRFNYDTKLSVGCVAIGGTIAAVIPPSIMLVLFGIVTEQSVGRLLIAGIFPGILTVVVYCLLVFVRAKLNPRLAPRGETFPWAERFKSLPGLVGIIVIFGITIGGIYAGIFTPTEAGSLGAFVALVMALAMRRMNGGKFRDSVTETLRVTCSIFLIIIGAYIFIQFLAISRLPIMFGEWIVGLPVPHFVVFIGVVILYLILGMFLEAIGNLLLTVPFIFFAMQALGFDGIWLGVIVVKLIELGMITPPVGLQAFILHGVAPDIPLGDIFKGFVPYFLVDLLVTIPILYIFPQIATFLPSTMGP